MDGLRTVRAKHTCDVEVEKILVGMEGTRGINKSRRRKMERKETKKLNFAAKCPK